MRGLPQRGPNLSLAKGGPAVCPTRAPPPSPHAFARLRVDTTRHRSNAFGGGGDGAHGTGGGKRVRVPGMAIPKVCGIETEYGIVVRGTEDQNPIAASSVLIHAYLQDVAQSSGVLDRFRFGVTVADHAQTYAAAAALAFDEDRLTVHRQHGEFQRRASAVDHEEAIGACVGFGIHGSGVRSTG